MPSIPYLLIRDVDPTTYNRVRKLGLLSRRLSREAWEDADHCMIAAARKAKIKVRRI